LNQIERRRQPLDLGALVTVAEIDHDETSGRFFPAA